MKSWKYPRNLIIIVAVNLLLFGIIVYFSDKIVVSKFWGGREHVNIRLSNIEPYRYISCPIKPIEVFSCQTGTVGIEMGKPLPTITPTLSPLRNPVPAFQKKT